MPSSGEPKNTKRVVFDASLIARIHTWLAFSAFGTALLVGCLLHYKKIVKNGVAGYPQEWFPSVSATLWTALRCPLMGRICFETRWTLVVGALARYVAAWGTRAGLSVLPHSCVALGKSIILTEVPTPVGWSTQSLSEVTEALGHALDKPHAFYDFAFDQGLQCESKNKPKKNTMAKAKVTPLPYTLGMPRPTIKTTLPESGTPSKAFLKMKGRVVDRTMSGNEGGATSSTSGSTQVEAAVSSSLASTHRVSASQASASQDQRHSVPSLSSQRIQPITQPAATQSSSSQVISQPPVTSSSQSSTTPSSSQIPYVAIPMNNLSLNDAMDVDAVTQSSNFSPPRRNNKQPAPDITPSRDRVAKKRRSGSQTMASSPFVERILMDQSSSQMTESDDNPIASGSSSRYVPPRPQRQVPPPPRARRPSQAPNSPTRSRHARASSRIALSQAMDDATEDLVAPLADVPEGDDNDDTEEGQGTENDVPQPHFAPQSLPTGLTARQGEQRVNLNITTFSPSNVQHPRGRGGRVVNTYGRRKP
ncbi:hypothetical protein ONZ45_g14578 [Pleurotus djamor]|nr:hypothetical protein ONZ45_g14578 [Pleurotus djamor]